MSPSFTAFAVISASSASITKTFMNKWDLCSPACTNSYFETTYWHIAVVNPGTSVLNPSNVQRKVGMMNVFIKKGVRLKKLKE